MGDCVIRSRGTGVENLLCGYRRFWKNRGDGAASGVYPVDSKISTVFSTAGRGTSNKEDEGERNGVVPCSDVGDSARSGGATGRSSGVGSGEKCLTREDLLVGLADFGLGKIRSGGILSPKWRASFERRLRRWLISCSSFDFSHSAGEKSVDLEVEVEMTDDGRFGNKDSTGLGTGDEM